MGSTDALPGLVETFDQDAATGWVETGAGAEPPRVDLYADDLLIDSTYASETNASYHALGETRVFRFALADIWDFVGPSNRLSVRLAGRPLPITGHGMFVAPDAESKHPTAVLRNRLRSGEQFNREGSLELPKSLNQAWQRDVLALYGSLREQLSRPVLLCYGMLLGAVRDDGFIGRDLDFDCAIVSESRDASAAGRDLQQVAFGLIDAGFAVQATPSHLRITAPGSPGAAVSLYHLFVDEAGAMQFPYGVVSKDGLSSEDWTPPTEMTFCGEQVLVPGNPAAALEHIYGPAWRTPDPGFSWSHDRGNAATDGLLPAAVVEEIYWADFYSRTTYSGGSTFFDLVNTRPGLPDSILDIGCGDGRDSFAFAAAGRAKVTGLDRSHVGVRQASRKAETLGYEGRLTFTACDVSDEQRLRGVLAAARNGQDPLAFYARFFLHSIPEEVQRTLIGAIAECARPGDYLAAEFRTDRDETIRKVHGSHYRRFQNGPAFGRSLGESYGFSVLLEQEGNGFSPYQGEDPYLYRVIAIRR